MSFFKSIFKNYPYLTLFSLFLFLFFLIFNVFSWTIPQDNPPNSNLPAPLNVSSQEQTKEGNLNINGLLRLGRFTSHPTGTNGALYYNTTDNKFYGYSNNSWQELGGGFWTLSNNNIYNTNSGNVGIGTTSPTSKLYVVGDFTATGTKNFEINHPTKPGKKLVHACIEGPEAAVYYRGEGKLIGGSAIIELPDYFEALTRKEGRTVQLTPKGTKPYLLSASEVKDGKLMVYGTEPDGEFYWEVKAVRADVEPLQVEK